MSDPGRPSIDHGLLSNSGHMSQRARDLALKREAAKLFPPGFWDVAPKTEEQVAAEAREADLRHASRLRDLAARGMKTRKYNREAAKIEAKY